MKTTLLSAGILTMAIGFASCSDNDRPDNPSQANGNAINFAARTEYSRAGDITTNTLKQFNVWAFTGSATSPVTFMSNVEVTKSGTNTWTYSPVQYWPADGSVDFYAFAPASWVGTLSPLSPIPYDAYGQAQDLIYAVNTNLEGNNGAPNAQVIFNFRHALSKVTFKMSSTNSNLIVKVSNVALANIMTKGNFHFPGESTTASPTATTMCKWTDQNTPMTYMLLESKEVSDAVQLTSTPIDMGDTGTGTGGTKYMIPQTLSYHNSGSGTDTYLTVMCSVYDAKTNTKLWPNENTPKEDIVEGSIFGDGLLKFPLNTSAFTEWSAGCHYIYNVVINSNEDMGTIDFGNPTVDTYIDVNTSYE